jgi:CheY-like chemotaxis protein
LRECVQNEQPDIILIDADMLGLEGPEAVQTVRAAPHLDAAPVVVQSTLTLPGDREKCMAAGANDYVAQPVAMPTLRARLEKLVEQHPVA